MMKFIKNKLKEEKGLTLIELLAVIVILAIIAAIAIPAIGNIIQNSRENAVIADAQNVLSAANLYFSEKGKEKTVTADALITAGYLESKGKLTTATVTNDSPDTITFTGEAGNKTASASGATAATLSEDGRGALTITDGAPAEPGE